MKFGRLAFFVLILAFLLPNSSRGESFLGRGATGQEIREVQDFLIKEGFMSVSSTGYFGLATERATRDFQSLWSLPGSGTWGPKTWTAKKITELKNQLQLLQNTLTTLLSSENSGYQGVDPRSIVGLSCYYEKNGVVVNRTKGSGAIISKDGLILTARHITDPSYAARVSPSQLSSQTRASAPRSRRAWSPSRAAACSWPIRAASFGITSRT